MKRIITYMAAMTALVLAFSCSRETMQDTRTGDGISLQVMWNEIATRADGDETEVNNEYAVNSLDWYFYKDTTAAPAFHYREAISGSDVKALKYIRDFVPGTEYGGVAFPHRADLCGADDCCTVFVVANLPSDKVNATATLATLKATEVAQTFLDASGKSPLAPDAETLNFIMTGQAQVKGTSLAVDKATAEVIELKRLAAKITYTVNVLKSKSNTVDGVTETWTPMLNGNNVRMYPQNVVKNAVLGAVDELYPTTLETGDAEILVVSSSDNKWDDSDTNYFVTKDALGPYYTYPYNWKNGGADTFVKIIVPWQVTRVQNNNVIYSAQREVYYKVLLPDPMTLSNTWYQLEITLAPGTENEPEVEVTAEYRVANWIGGGEQGVDGVLKDIKYLIADRSDEIPETGQEHGHFVTYTRGISIPYSASNPVIFKVIEASYTDFSTETPSEKKFVTTNAAGVTTYTNPNSGNNNQKHLGTTTNGTSWSMVQNLSTIEGWFHFDNGSDVGDAEGHLILDHWLNADLTSIYFDASPYTFTVRIYLERDPDNYVEELKIIQYPQTYIEAQESTVHANSPAASASNEFYGYIFINGISEVTNAGYNSPWTTIMSIGSNYSRRTNHNMYILTTGVLADDTKRLGDPREEASYNAPKATGATVTFTSAPPVGGGANRSMTNYHPTDAAKSATFIAPKLRISSAFGRRGSNSNHNSEYNASYNMSEDNANYNYASAWNRCASYQEDGYPAGRWRLPTEAEILYINTLSTKGYIPGMFNGPTPYWTATPGRAVRRVSTNPEVVRIDSGYTQASTRCVYDDWYWGSEPVSGAQNTFMWGD